MSERIADPRFRRSPAGAVALSVLAVGLGGWGIVNSPVFATRRIEVEGNRHLSAADVVEAAGVGHEQNLIRLSTENVAERVSSLPWVREAVASRDLPTTLVLRVVERTATAWFQDPAGVAVVARDGTVLDRPVQPPRRFPRVDDVASAQSVGESVASPPPGLRVVASMGSQLLGRVSAAASQGGQVVVELRGGGAVRYGPPTQLALKNRALSEMLGWARREGLSVASIDLRVPDAPTLEPRLPGREPSAHRRPDRAPR
jgi:cell division septal protein FtsQ